MKAVGERPWTEHMCIMRTAGLTKEYCHITAMAEGLSPEDNNPQRIEGMLISEYSRMQMQKVEETPTATKEVLKTEVMFAKNPNSSQQGGTDKMPQIETRKCYNCTKVGRFRKRLPKVG